MNRKQPIVPWTSLKLSTGQVTEAKSWRRKVREIYTTKQVTVRYIRRFTLECGHTETRITRTSIHSPKSVVCRECRFNSRRNANAAHPR